MARVRGSVVEVSFANGEAPLLREALEIAGADDRAEPLVLEVQQHLDPRTVRTVALQITSGLRRGAEVRRTRGPLAMPVGPSVLGRLIDVHGRPTDGGSPSTRRSIRSSRPRRSSTRASSERMTQPLQVAPFVLEEPHAAETRPAH